MKSILTCCILTLLLFNIMGCQKNIYREQSDSALQKILYEDSQELCSIIAKHYDDGQFPSESERKEWDAYVTIYADAELSKKLSTSDNILITDIEDIYVNMFLVSKSSLSKDEIKQKLVEISKKLNMDK